MLPLTVTAPPVSTRIPPPLLAELPTKVLPLTISVPLLSMPPPLLAELPAKVHSFTVSLPLLLMPPPLPPDNPFSMVRLLRIATVPPISVKTVLAEAPFTVTRLVSVAPLPEVAPVRMVLVGIMSVPSTPSVMVLAAAVLPALNTVGSKLMLPPAAAAASRASRSVHAPLPVPGGFAGQLEAAGVELSSWFVFTANEGTVSKSAVTVSAAFMVTVVLALLALLMSVFASQPAKE